MKIHPDADIFPMLPDDELAELAADIKANGQLHPIIIDDDGQIVDGRNRFQACKLAGVEPRFEKLNGHDPKALIVSANLARRNLSKGQKAVALAMIYPEGQRGRGKNADARKAQESWGFSEERLRQARAVLRHSRDLASDVLKGLTQFDAAVEHTRSAQGTAERKAEQAGQMRKGAPDLSDLVEEGRMTFEEAFAAFGERERMRQIGMQRAIGAARDFVSHFSGDVEAIVNSGKDAGVKIKPDQMRELKRWLIKLEEFARENSDE